MQNVPLLDLTAVMKQHSCLKPVVDRFVAWYNKHSYKMGELERVECQWSLDNMSTTCSQLFIPYDNKVYRRYLGVGSYCRTARDLTWPTFYLLRLLYVDFHEEVVRLMVEDTVADVPSKVHATRRKFFGSPIATFIKERYGIGIDLETEEFPGPAPPRPASWPALGLKLVLVNAPGEPTMSKTLKRKNHASIRKDCDMVSDDDDNDEETSDFEDNDEEAFNLEDNQDTAFDPTNISLPTLSERPRRSKRARLSSVEGTEMDLGDLFTNQSVSQNNASSPGHQNEALRRRSVNSPQETRVHSREHTGFVESQSSAVIPAQEAVEPEVCMLQNRQDARAALERELLGSPLVSRNLNCIFSYLATDQTSQPLTETNEEKDRAVEHRHLSNIRREIAMIHEREERAETRNRATFEAMTNYLKTMPSQSQSDESMEALRAQVQAQKSTIQQQQVTINGLGQENQKVKEQMKELKSYMASLTSRLEKFFPVLKADEQSG